MPIRRKGLITVPDFEPLFELKPNIYKVTCPVLLQSGALFCVEPEEEEGETRTYAALTFRNIDDRAITALYVDLHAFDKANQEMEVIRDHRYLVPVAGRDETFGEDVELPVGAAATSFSVAIKRVEFEGEDIWTGSASFLFENVPERKTLEEALEDEALLEQYRRDYRETMSEAGKGDAIYVPETYKDLWLCTCGGVNHTGEERCFNCGAAFGPQLELFEDREKLAENLEAYIKAEEEKAEQARLEAERKAEEERRAAEEAARKAEEERLAEEARIRRKKRNFKIFLWVSIPLVILAILFVIALITYLIPQNKYEEAEAMAANGQYDEAVAAFAALEDFGDSAARIPQVKYQKGEYLLETEKFDEAVAVFEEVIEQEGAEEQITEAKYRKAVKTLEAKAYTDALRQFELLGDYKECAEHIALCYFELGMKAVDEDDLETATAYYEKVNDKQKTEMQSAFCDKGVAFYEAGEEARALEYFTLVTEEELLPKIDAAYYAQGLKLMEAKEYDAAMEIFTKLGEFEDCPVQIQKIHYIKAEEAAAAGEYETALAEYEAAGDYKDVTKKVRNLTYDHGVALLNAGRVVDAYETLYTIRNYFPAYELLVSNPQFHRYVYDKNIGPNPNFEKLVIEFE